MTCFLRGVSLVELMMSIAILSVLCCFAMPLYVQHQSAVEMRLFEKELSSMLTTARLEAFLLEKPLRIEPFRLDKETGAWQDGVRLRLEEDERGILHQWSWPRLQGSVTWFGFRSRQYIAIDAFPEKMAMNGYFQVGEHQVFVNRFGRVRS